MSYLRITRLIVVSIVVGFATSCEGGGDLSPAEQARLEIIEDLARDQRKEIEEAKLEQARKDSIGALEPNKVIGDITFGLSPEEGKEALAQFKKECTVRQGSGSYAWDQYFIADFQFISVDPYYHDEQLYKIDITGMSTDWDMFDIGIPKKVKQISSVISKKYGSPSTDYGITERYKMEKGYNYTVHKWVIGRKVIEVYVSEYNARYSVDVRIFLPEVIDQISKEKKQNEEKASEEAKDVF